MKGQEQREVKGMHEYGDCSFCGGEVKEGKVELDYRYQGKLFVFQNVPAGVCQQCGEKYLTAKIAKEIEHRIQTKENWDQTISVPVDILPEEIAA
jgi:YgiT-type zinc finger domain-containing protein